MLSKQQRNYVTNFSIKSNINSTEVEVQTNLIQQFEVRHIRRPVSKASRYARKDRAIVTSRQRKDCTV